MKDEVVSTISHELRTPIATIRGYGELLVDGDLGDLAPAQADAVAKMLRNAARLTSLVDNLVYLDRDRSTGEVPLRLGQNDLAALVGKARESLDHVARDRDLTLRVEVPDSPVPVRGDSPALLRVVSHLGGNAIKFTPDGGTVTLTVAATPGGSVLTVADTGIGMSEEDRARARDRFYRSSEAYRLAVPGIGLGLSVVDGIVAAHDGTMDIVSAPGRGTTVTVVLPAHEEDAPTD
jgi:signal transduction histidine kinase